MDIETVLGIKWHKASGEDLVIVFLVLMVPVVLMLLIKIFQYYRNKKIHEKQLFLFKLKRLGLSNFQIKIINNLIEILRFSNPNLLLKNPNNFESAVGQFLTHTRVTGETEESQSMICKDITIIYDKLYLRKRAKKQLKIIQNIDDNQLIYFTLADNKVFLGKIVSHDAKMLYMKIIGTISDFPPLQDKKEILFHVYRVGDGEYEFTSTITGREGAVIHVDIPEEVIKREESRHPYIDVIITATVAKTEQPPRDKELEELEEIIERDEKIAEPAEDGPIDDEIFYENSENKLSCTIYKINDYEAVLRMDHKLDFNYRYILEFNEMDFNFRIISKIISTKTVEEGGAVYYTVKFDEMSESASRVLKRYVYEHL